MISGDETPNGAGPRWRAARAPRAYRYSRKPTKLRSFGRRDFAYTRGELVEMWRRGEQPSRGPLRLPPDLVGARDELAPTSGLEASRSERSSRRGAEARSEAQRLHQGHVLLLSRYSADPPLGSVLPPTHFLKP